jgi:hypothetical protein
MLPATRNSLELAGHGERAPKSKGFDAGEAIAAFWLFFPSPAAAHQAHEFQASIQIALPIAPINAGTARGAQSAVPTGVLSTCTEGCIGGADCCGLQTCTPCAGPCGAGLIATASALGISVAISRNVGRSEPQMAGRTVAPLEKPPRT